jgi:Ca2+-binding RTX toxin-like protein
MQAANEGMTVAIDGTSGDDTIFGTSGNDTINGLEGNDTLFGDSGDDILNGGPGNDMLGGEAGNDRMAGGPGDDRIIVYDPGDVVIELPGEGNDTVISMINFTLAPAVSVENLELFEAAGSRNLTGNEISQTIRGNTSDNILTGGPIGTAPDVLIGGGGKRRQPQHRHRMARRQRRRLQRRRQGRHPVAARRRTLERLARPGQRQL